jgi:hypothetical protein
MSDHIYTVSTRSEFNFAVLGPNPDAGKDCVPYAGKQLTICITDGKDDAELIAAALNAYRPVAA